MNRHLLAAAFATLLWAGASHAAEPAFVHSAGTVGQSWTSIGLDVGTSWGRGPAEIAPTLRLSYGIHRRAEFGVRVGVLGDSVDGFKASTGLQIPILLEVSLGALREENLRWEVGVTLLGGLRNFGGVAENSQPEGGLEVGASVRLSSWALAFARGGYVVTRVGQEAPYLGRDQAGENHGSGQSLLRHHPSLTLGLELALEGLRPFLGVQGALRFDPYQEVEPRLQVMAGAAYVF
ncbi:MAG: hypothetical protein HY901_22335 [Deltaproteobacteria bacterium]|nr:hypothetical protein [Deltaproteobacteria bacterium]